MGINSQRISYMGKVNAKLQLILADALFLFLRFKNLSVMMATNRQ